MKAEGPAVARPTQGGQAEASGSGKVSAAAVSGPASYSAVARIFEAAAFTGQGVLLETEGMALLDAIGITTPRRFELADAKAAAALADPPLAGERVVLKVVAPALLHKTEARGVVVLPNRRDAVVAEIDAMERRFADQPVAGYVLYEFVPHDATLGHEFLLGMRWTRDFGPVVTLGPGGIHAEYLVQAFREGEGLAVCSPVLGGREDLERALGDLAPTRLVTERRRGRAPELSRSALVDAVGRFLDLAREFCPRPIAEFEVNPLVVSDGRLVALDALLTLSRSPEEADPPRPLEKIRRLLEPRSIAVVGVSEKLNPGRIILQNILREGFPAGSLTIVKPGIDSIDGCRCVPSLAALPGPVDVVVLSVAAAPSAEMLLEIAQTRCAESVLLISGGLEEKPGTEGTVARMRQGLAQARATEWRGPVVNGGNCLGIRSVPGRYNTLFIPEHKLPVPRGAADPLALVTGSGAFAVSKISKLAGVNPLYTITVGNQMDLTVSDYLEHLEDDRRVEVFAVYLEGFKTLDGLRFLSAAERIAAAGRTVILYRAGRTPAGAAAAASHTAAVAGDQRITRRLAQAAGVVVAETLEDFEDLVRLFAWLHDRPPAGLRLAAVSNAGYECVAIADNLGIFALAPLASSTVSGLEETLERARLHEILSVRNPMDLTPIMGDADYETVVRLMLGDPGADVGLVGCVPLTGALNTLAPGPGHRDDIARPESIVQRLIRLRDEVRKPWVAVVDAGRLYDPMAQRLEDARIPTFRAADRALRLFGTWCRARLSRPFSAHA